MDDRVRGAASTVEAGHLEHLLHHPAPVGQAVEVNDEVDRLVQLVVSHLRRQPVLACTEVERQLVERSLRGGGVHGGERRLAVRHRLQHRHSCIAVTYLTAHQPVGAVPQRVLHLLPLGDRSLALVVGQALLPRLDVRSLTSVEEVELGRILDNDDPGERVERRQACADGGRLPRPGRAGEDDPDLGRTHACPQQVGDLYRKHVHCHEIVQGDFAERVPSDGERDVLRDVARGCQAKPLTETHHEHRHLAVELTLGSASRSSEVPKPSVEVSLRTPQALSDQFHRSV